MAVDEVMNDLERRPTRESEMSSKGKVFFLQGTAGNGKTYTLNVLIICDQTRGIIVELEATTGIATTIYKGGRTVPSLLVIGIDDKERADGASCRSSRYGPRSERGEPLCRASPIIIAEASPIQRWFFELTNDVLKDLRCVRLDENRADTRPKYGGINIAFAGDYMKLLPVLPSRSWKDRDGEVNGHCANLSLLDEIKWGFSLCYSLRLVRLTRKVLQAEDRDFRQKVSAI